MRKKFEMLAVQQGHGQDLIELMEAAARSYPSPYVMPGADPAARQPSIPLLGTTGGTGVVSSQNMLLFAEDEPSKDGEEDKPYEMIDGIAVLSIRGKMVANESFFTRWLDIPSYEGIRNALVTAYDDSAVEEILFDASTPGGPVSGISDLGDLITEVRGKKRVFTHAAGDLASAGMWLFSNADGFFASRTSQLGSIGAILVHVSYAKMLKENGIKVTEIKSGEFKAVGSPAKDLTEKEQAYLQALIDKSAELFYAEMVKNRPNIDRDTFNGAVFMANDAHLKGMIDGVQSYDATVAHILGSRPAKTENGEPTLAVSRGSGFTENILQLGDDPMKKQRKKVIARSKEATEAAIAAGADPAALNANNEATPAVSASAGTPAPAVSGPAGVVAPGAEAPATSAAGDPPAVSPNPEASAPEITATAEELQAQVTALQTEAAELTAARDAALAEVAEMKAGYEALEATSESMKGFMVERLTQMRLALGLATVDFSEMPTESVAREYKAVNTMFVKAFKVAGIAPGGAAADESTPGETEAQVTSLDNARLRSVGIGKK